MELEEILSEDSIKLIDSNTISRIGINILRILYNSRDAEQIDSDIVSNLLSDFSISYNAFRRGINVFFIPEVTSELTRLLDSLNRNTNFLIDRSELNDPLSLDKLKELSLAEKILYRIINFSKKRDIFSSSFVDSEVKREYEIYLNKLREIVSGGEVKIDFGERYGISTREKKHNLETDEKLLAISLTLARNNPVYLFSSDSDMIRMARNFDLKNLPNFYLFSDFKGVGDFTSQIIQDVPV